MIGRFNVALHMSQGIKTIRVDEGVRHDLRGHSAKWQARVKLADGQSNSFSTKPDQPRSLY
jgi:hypothetical protein